MITQLLSISEMATKIVAGLSGVIVAVIVIVIFVVRSKKKG